jgi:hypothetical protein
MNQLSVKNKTHPFILNSINNRNYFSFKSNYLFRFKSSQKETKLNNIYIKQFLTNSPFLSNNKPIQIFFKKNYKNFLFYIYLNFANRQNPILKNISTNLDDLVFYSKNSLNPLKKPIKFFKKNKKLFLLNKPFQPFVPPTMVHSSSKFKKRKQFNFLVQKKPIKIILNTLFLKLLKPSIQYLRMGLLNSNCIQSKMKKYLILLSQQFSQLNQCNQYLLTQFITVNLAYSMLIVYINRHFRSGIFFNRVGFLLAFINNYCKIKDLFIQINRSFYYFNVEYDIFDSIQFFKRLNKNYVLSNTLLDWNLIKAKIFNLDEKNKTMLSILIKKILFLPVQTTLKLQLYYYTPYSICYANRVSGGGPYANIVNRAKNSVTGFIKMNCAKNQFLKKYHFFNQKQIRNVIFTENRKNLNLGKLLQENLSNQIKLKLWKTSKKRHNQKSFNWVFKKYGSLVNFYKQVKIPFSSKEYLLVTTNKYCSHRFFVKKRWLFFYKKNNCTKKSFKSILKTQNIFFFKNLLRKKLEINYHKKSLSKFLMFLIRKNLQFEALTLIKIDNLKVIFLDQKNITKGILNIKISHKFILNLYQFLILEKNHKNKYFYETYYFQN